VLSLLNGPWRSALSVLTLIALCSVNDASGQSGNHGASRINDAEITRAVDVVRADPDLAAEQTIKTLSWKRSSETKRSETPSWLKWIAGLFAWVDQSAGILMWGTIAFLAVMLIVYLVRIVRVHGLPTPGDAFVAPTHVRDLDIRPETLPDDIGTAARVLWDSGEHRAALALLYRGLLSRLAHVHRVPIRDSSTEGDCLALAAAHLAADKQGYTAALVRAWQRFVYGGEDVDTAAVHSLCDGFARALNSAPTTAARGSA
jgi:hypothetical protein